MRCLVARSALHRQRICTALTRPRVLKEHVLNLRVARQCVAYSQWSAEGVASPRLSISKLLHNHKALPHETPLFSAGYCCLAIEFESIPFRSAAPFHGEIAVNPSTGAIVRLTIQADLPWRLPLERSDVMVEYGPVVKGSRTFICPIRSVSISRQRRTMVVNEWGEGLRVYAPYETLLNEMHFEKYHILGSTSLILPGFVEVTQEK